MAGRWSKLNDIERMLKKYEDNLSGSKQVYLPIVERYLREKKDFSKRSIKSYLEKLEKEGYSDGYINLIYRTLARFCRVNEIEWPFKRKEVPHIREKKVYAPALDPKYVTEIIEAAKKGVFNDAEAAMIALSTTYGLRRSEMAGMTKEDVDIKNKILFVETAKSGRQRYHIIPDEILPYISEYSFPQRTPTSLTLMWYRIEKKLGWPRLREVGWHAIRRILNRQLIDAGLNPLTVSNFLRWKRSSTEMVALYYNITIVGIDGRIEIDKPDREVDEAVFAVHPFLPYWRENDAEKKKKRSNKAKKRTDNKTRNSR